MARRTYGQDCALARSADLVGERWTLLLVRDLLITPRRFNELQRSLHGIGSNLLATRLKELEHDGIVETCGDGQGFRRYRLTSRGRALEPAILSLIRWGFGDEAGAPNDGHHRDDWDLLALKAFFRAERAESLDLTVQFHTVTFTGWARICYGRMDIGVGEVPSPDLVVDGDVRALFRGNCAPGDLLSSGSAGDLAAFTRAFAT